MPFCVTYHILHVHVINVGGVAHGWPAVLWDL